MRQTPPILIATRSPLAIARRTEISAISRMPATSLIEYILPRSAFIL